jgi:glycosyltransferase involved in cell wall biosynthesis
MKIAIIGPGIMPIPPKGWGAVESLIWDYYTELITKGHEVKIVNSSDPIAIINQTNEFNPEFVHLQYDDYAHLLNHINCKFKAVTSHYGYIEQYNAHPEYHHILNNFVNGDFLIFCLSEGIKNTYLSLGVDKNRLYITPNGARQDLFKYTKEASSKDRSIYLAKIDYRKRQFLFQNIPNLDFAGNCIDHRFNTSSSNYLGEWTKEFLYQNLTNYSNLVLLSDGEADPLVTKEALIAGLGLVISECASANLDKSLPFIDIIPNEKINDTTYIEEVLIKNRNKSNEQRENIRSYALTNHSWDIVVENYIKLIESIIKK